MISLELARGKWVLCSSRTTCAHRPCTDFYDLYGPGVLLWCSCAQRTDTHVIVALYTEFGRTFHPARIRTYTRFGESLMLRVDYLGLGFT
jgi:hypothetical protein